jgi:hypothetical protein
MDHEDHQQRLLLRFRRDFGIARHDPVMAVIAAANESTLSLIRSELIAVNERREEDLTADQVRAVVEAVIAVNGELKRICGGPRPRSRRVHLDD